MKFRKIGLMVAIILLSLCLLAPMASAKKKKTNVKKKFMDHTFLVAGDIGANVFSAIPFGTITINKGASSEKDVDFSGTGGFGFLFGAHAHIFLEGWIVRAEFQYARQPGEGTYKIDGTELNFDYVMNDTKLGIGFGKGLMPKQRMLNPYIIAVLNYHYLTWRNTDEDDNATGHELGLGGILGLDFKIPKMPLVVGAGARIDLLYTINPLTIGDDEITMGYLPISFFLNGGWLFL